MLSLKNISKQFPGVKALSDVTLSFDSGQIHALCGENGAGKSTLMNIIMGNLQPDEGQILLNQKVVEIKDVLAAKRLGMAIVYQERSLVDSLSIAENIFPVVLPTTSLGTINFQALHGQTTRLLDELGLGHLSPRILVGKLSAAQKQMIEIAKAIAQNPRVLILDEPTASLTYSETEVLFKMLKRLKSEGVGIIYISHRMAELQQIADKISILKDGQFVATVDAGTPIHQIISLMVGRELETMNADGHAKPLVVLEVQGLCGKDFTEIDFQLHEGEIFGFAGLEGSGRSSMAKALFGEMRITSGTVTRNGKALLLSHPRHAIDAGIIYVPEDRKSEGLFLFKSIVENIFSARLKGRYYNEKIASGEARELCKTYAIRTPAVKQQVRKLSGGNQQKTLLAKWISLNPDILIVNEPTHGVDVGSKAEIYQLLKKLTAQGKSILLISSELPELLMLCDRIAVMHNGKISRVLDRKEATEERITTLASGINN